MKSISASKANTERLLLNNCSLEGFDILVLSPTPTYPIDKGNRKRIYSVCQQLKEKGAKIHFLYYPQDWVSHLPTDALQEMGKQWDSVHLAPSTRPLQTRAKENDHTIDEWWDDAIGDYLKWLFSHHYYDAFIVNYTYLSKALEFAPKHVYRILDTHDKFTGRRELLESQGISAEFFHTTQEEEARALKRADLVWAIKEEEEEFFKKIAPTPVCTVPHIEPYQLIERETSPEDEDYLVLGMIGVGNSINIRNAREFIEQAFPKFKQYLAPIKLKFAGTICNALEDLEERAGIELMGLVETVEDFYKAIDVAIIPMNFSTGLKIKAVEALTKGVPIVAHAHAFEGIPTTHPYHTCDSFEQMAQYCLDLAYNKHKLKDLADATEATYHKVRLQVEGAMAHVSHKIAKGKPYILIVFPHSFFEEDALEYHHTIQTIEYFKYLGPLIYYIDTPLDPKTASLLKWRDTNAKIVLSPQALENSTILEGQSLNICFTVSTLEQLTQNRKIAAIWMLGMPEELKNRIPREMRNIPTYIRTDVLNIYESQEPDLEPLSNILKQFNKITLVHCGYRFLFQNQTTIPHAEIAIVPYWRELLSEIRSKIPEKKAIILADFHLMQIAYTLWNMCCELFDEGLEPLVILPQKPELDSEMINNTEEELWQKDRKFISSLLSLSEFMGDIELFGELPQLVIDLSGEHLSFAPYRETIKRAIIPLVMPSADANLGWQNISSTGSIIKPLSVFHLIEVISKVATDEDYLKEFMLNNRQSANFEYSKDAGWAKIWQQMKKNLVISDIIT